MILSVRMLEVELLTRQFSAPEGMMPSQSNSCDLVGIASSVRHPFGSGKFLPLAEPHPDSLANVGKLEQAAQEVERFGVRPLT